MAPGGIFCLEGQWERNLEDRSSVLPTLELLHRIGRARYIHKDVATPEELDYFLTRWMLKRYQDYHVGAFAMHGEPNKVWLTDRKSLTLPEIAVPLAGRATDKWLYFGSCGVLRTPDAQLEEFLQTTGAALVCGYTRAVDWVESAAFETVLLDVLANNHRPKAVEQRMGSARWAGLAASLGFRIRYADGNGWRPSKR